MAELREKYVRDQFAVQEYGYYKGIKEGIEQGIEQGKLKEKYETAKRLKKDDVDIEVIMIATGLSKEEIEAL